MAEESPTKKARTVGYYRIIKGEKYDRELLEMAEAFAKDGQISYPEAKKLLESAKDGQTIAGIEKSTLRYVMDEFKLTPKANNFLEVSLKDTSISYFIRIDGKDLDRALYSSAERSAADGQISKAEGEALIQIAKDDYQVTDNEKATLRYCLEKFKWTAPAKTQMEIFLAGKEAPAKITEAASPAAAREVDNENKPYYEHIDGGKYVRKLLEKARAFNKDGQISKDEAQKLLNLANNGSGITACEKLTLWYTMDTMRYTTPAKTLMVAALKEP